VPGGARTDHISERDVEVLEFIARYGVVPRDAVALWADTGKTVTQTRERRLAVAGLIEVSTPLGGLPVAVATRAGLGACERSELPLARISPSNFQHDAVCARLGARLEREGYQLLSERELRAEEGAWGRRDYSIRLRTRSHRPDMLRVGELRVPVEAELTRKAQGRLEEIVHRWRAAVDAGRFHRVLYYCTAEVLPYVQRAVDRAEAEVQIRVEQLADEDLLHTSLFA
jgi:hypothetical protein